MLDLGASRSEPIHNGPRLGHDRRILISPAGTPLRPPAVALCSITSVNPIGCQGESVLPLEPIACRMNREQFFLVMIISGPLLGLTTAALIKIYGYTRLLTGIALAIVASFTVLLGWILVVGPPERWKTLLSLLCTCVPVLFTGFIQFLRGGKKEDKTASQKKVPVVAAAEDRDSEDSTATD